MSTAEMVAADLRRQIVAGKLADGTFLPRQDDLLDLYAVSRPSLREALRVLESEGLISIRRGKLGGAVVHRPSLHMVAQTLGLVLDSQNVSTPDVSTALNLLEPQCVALCAAREDRHKTVIPLLKDSHENAASLIDDVQAFTVASRRFHEILVTECGNFSLTLLVGALEAVWTSRAREWAARSEESRQFPDRAYREQGLKDHEILIAILEDGDVEKAFLEASRHLEWAPVYSVDEQLGIVGLGDGHLLD
ncbi:MAG: GntR family transcriptional regulator [Actinomycetota bacterium]|nr:GntR family transcriptional regulator [Actinomycetota bacterium]MDA3001792.1 GntR family transcriptional regulator [Actinomycetota bacterium]